ncbi:rhodanese-like domain-containing protein [Sulfitobacter aestuarii]|uniref:Rhodanese-like domain-containing protein n=1 Tax=Sulfitobacter aestuarii TaxID=2161676 RepID=A0ABW5U9M9_9RHOB
MQSEDHNGATLETWTPQEVASAQNTGDIILVDVRTPAEYAFEHVEGALLLPMAEFDPAFLPSQQDRRIVLVCGSSQRSAKMAKKMIEAGAERIAHLEGGFTGWKEAHQPYIGTDMASGAPQRKENRPE